MRSVLTVALCLRVPTDARLLPGGRRGPGSAAGADQPACPGVWRDGPAALLYARRATGGLCRAAERPLEPQRLRRPLSSPHLTRFCDICATARRVPGPLFGSGPPEAAVFGPVPPHVVVR